MRVLLLAIVTSCGVASIGAQNCAEIIRPDTLAAEDTGGDVAFCADFDYRIALRSERYLDGVRISGFADGCNYDSLVFYPYFTFPHQGTRGPYVLEQWTVDGRTLRDTFADIPTLVAQLNAFDPRGGWTNDPITKNIMGGAKGSRYGDMRVLHIADGTRRTVAANYQAIARGTQISARGRGFHAYTIFDPRTNCRDTVVIFLKPVLPVKRDTVTTRAQTLSREFCVDNSGLIGRPGTARLCSATPQGRLNTTSPYCFTYAPAAGFSGSEDICIEVCDDTRQLGGPVCQRTIVTVIVGPARRVRTDTVRVTIAPRDTTVCLDAVLQIARPITSTTTCSAAAADLTFVPRNTGCVTLQPRADFTGLVEGCVVHCAEGVCDTTRLFVTVVKDCTADLFPVKRDSVGDGGTPTSYCIAVAPSTLSKYALAIDGVPYTGRRGGCTFESQFFYNYAPLFEQGREGPYTLVAWPVDGASFSTQFATMPELVNFMQASDPQGDWRLDPTDFYITGGRASGTYGSLSIVHDATGTRSELVPNPVDRPAGTTIDLPGRGTYSISAIDSDTGCRDAMTVKVGADAPAGTKKTIVVQVAYETQSPRTCLFDALRDEVQRCGNPRNGTATLDANACAVYQPRMGFIGRDTMCVLTCSLPGSTPCDTTIVIFEVTRAALVTDTVRVNSFGESPVLACANVPFGGPYRDVRFCGAQGPFTAVAASGTCVRITPAAGAIAAGQICAEYCSVADPTYCQRVIFVVTPTAACAPDVLARDSLTLPPSVGTASVCLGDGVDLSAYTIKVNGQTVTPGSDASCGKTTTTGGGGGSATVLSYNAVFLNETNPIRIEGWDVGGALVSGVEANGLVALADSMSAHDPNATWTYDPGAAAILANVATGTYSMIVLFDLADGSVYQLPLESTTTGGGGTTTFVPGAVIPIPRAGRYVVTVARQDGSCGDQQVIYRQPQQRPKRDTIDQDVSANEINGPFCLASSELSGPLASIVLCGGPSEGVVGFAGTNCYTYAPRDGFIGRDLICLVICAEGGLECDTTVVQLNVTLAPVPTPTRDTVRHNLQPDVRSQTFCLSAAQLPGAADRRELCATPQNGTLDFSSTLCYTYTPAPGYLGTDAACVIVCSGSVCDTTILLFNVQARSVGNGTTRETMRLTVPADTLSDEFCLSSAELPGAPTDLLTCGLPRNGNLTFVGDSCFTFMPNPGFLGMDTACLLLCSGGVCDTTTVIFTVTDGPIIGNPKTDTLRQNVLAGRRNGPLCVDVSELPGTPTNSSICRRPRHGQLLLSGNACYTYEPTAGYVGQDTACILVCSGPICDTTILVFTIVSKAPCDNFTPVTPMTFELSSCDSTARFEFTTGITDLAAVQLTLNGVAVAGQRNGSLIAVSLPVGKYQLAARDTVRDCVSTFDISVSCDDGCELPLSITELTRYVACDTGLVSVCLPTTIQALSGFSISVDGVAYDDPLGECGSAERLVFDVSALGAGPFQVDSFRIDRAFFSAQVGSAQVLADALSVWDAGVSWRYDAANATVSGGSAGKDYSDLPITDLSTARTMRFVATKETVSAGIAILLPLGTPVRNLRFSNQAGTCQQDVSLTLECTTNSDDELSVAVDEELLYCVDVSELNGPVVSLSNACPGPEDIAAVDFDAVTSCVSVRGVHTGTSTVCLVACDALGVCDTTFVNITVTPAVAPPAIRAVDDRFRIVRNTELVSSLIVNDTFIGTLDKIRLLTSTSLGLASVSPDGIFSYRPNADACDFTDTLLYEICQRTSCDQATITIRVRCGAVEVYRGFSPNGDGINDFFTIEGIEAFPESVLTVFNRWGNQVFTAVGYRNDWAGTWTDRTLTSGTYFYLLEIPGEEVISGWVQVAR